MKQVTDQLGKCYWRNQIQPTRIELTTEINTIICISVARLNMHFIFQVWNLLCQNVWVESWSIREYQTVNTRNGLVVDITFQKSGLCHLVSEYDFGSPHEYGAHTQCCRKIQEQPVHLQWPWSIVEGRDFGWSTSAEWLAGCQGKSTTTQFSEQVLNTTLMAVRISSLKLSKSYGNLTQKRFSLGGQ